jgi:hypothetical protein|tara:strand:- start:363 stop:578 length:216 start_codon:yes stop_codon:yes gene_type:complete
MYSILIILLFLLIILSIVGSCNKEPFIESSNIYKNYKKNIRVKRKNIENFSKKKIDDVKYKVKKFIRIHGL